MEIYDSSKSWKDLKHYITSNKRWSIIYWKLKHKLEENKKTETKNEVEIKQKIYKAV